MTRNKRESGALAEQLNVFQHFVDASVEGMGWAELDGTIRYANAALARFIGVDEPADAIGIPVQSLYDEATQVRLGEEVFPAILAGGIWTGELVLHPLQGDAFPTQNSLFVLRDADGEPVYFANVIRNLTTAKRSEGELAEYREHLPPASG